MSFAQFERQIIAERTRDKIHACRRRGRWTGGRPVLAYDTTPAGGAIVVNADEAQQVRAIFEMYLETPSLIGMAQELNRRGWRQKRWINKSGQETGGSAWEKSSLRTLLTNPLYAGLQKLGDETFRGEHDAIVPKKLYDRVQRLMDGNRRDGGATARNSHGFLLRGLIRCAACGSAMTPSWSRSHGRLYRYYRCSHAEKNGHAACPSKMIPADGVERIVVDEIRRIGASPELQQATFDQAVGQVKAQRRGLKREKKQLERDLAATRANVERLVAALARASGSGADAVAAELERDQDRVRTVEARLAEIQDEIASLQAQEIDRDDLARALVEWDELWSVLLVPERERVLRLLIERIGYDGRDGKLEILWRLAGFGELAGEIAP